MKKFHISDVLTVTTGKLVSTRGIAGLYDILNYMTNDNLLTHQIPRAMRECRPFLLEQYPVLVEVTGAETEYVNLDFWLEEQIERFGEYFYVEPLPEGVHKYIDPINELIYMTHDNEDKEN